MALKEANECERKFYVGSKKALSTEQETGQGEGLWKEFPQAHRMADIRNEVQTLRVLHALQAIIPRVHLQTLITVPSMQCCWVSVVLGCEGKE